MEIEKEAIQNKINTVNEMVDEMIKKVIKEELKKIGIVIQLLFQLLNTLMHLMKKNRLKFSLKKKGEMLNEKKYFKIYNKKERIVMD